MDRVQKNGGTAGLVTAVLLALLFVLFFSLGQDTMTPGDPAKSLAAVTQKWSLFNLTAFVGLLAAGFGVLAMLALPIIFLALPVIVWLSFTVLILGSMLMGVVSLIGRSLNPPRKREPDQLPDSAPTTSSSR